ncbi:hypothetical protein Cni_G17921 [Canna indica]|uniref:Homeobox-leucine zipper protein n=1 Tax=Canna indica TaxID=4628 RepID=A0AAQ3KHX6_9LILI|nr:hypothetical protein Cni_G17921 [Canna indica]
MAGRRHLESSTMAVLLQNDGMYKNCSGPLFSTGATTTTTATTTNGILGSWPLVSFEDCPGNNLTRPLFRQIELEDITGDGDGDGDFDDCLHHPEKKRRLTADQAQFLERSFEFENKLEPERKLQLAKALGLKPRQVAIWFQNRRARWKTKQLERDFEALKSSYDALKLDHGCLLKDKEELEAEVFSLTKRLVQREKKGSELQPHKLPNLDSGFEVKKSQGQAMACKQEDISAANSTILDSESPHCNIDEGGYSMLMELTGSSNAFELDNSDRSQIGEVDDANDCGLLSLEDDSGGYAVKVAEQGFWLWSN